MTEIRQLCGLLFKKALFITQSEIFLEFDEEGVIIQTSTCFSKVNYKVYSFILYQCIQQYVRDIGEALFNLPQVATYVFNPLDSP